VSAWQDYAAAALVKPRTIPQWILLPIAWLVIVWGFAVVVLTVSGVIFSILGV